MKTSFRALLSLWLIAWGTSGAAAWQAVSTEHLVILLPAGFPQTAAVALQAEETLQQVWELWLPRGVDTPLPRPSPAWNLSPAVIARAWERAGIPPEPAGPSFGLILYQDPEQLWQDADKYGVKGLYLGVSWAPRSLVRELRRRFHQAGIAQDWVAQGLVLAYCPQGECPGLLAHELTHALQDYTLVSIPTEFCPQELDREPRLIIEGMATWTEFALDPEDDFQLLVQGPVAIWLWLGGSPSEVPLFLLYQIGASLFQFLSFRLSPPEMLALFSHPVRGMLGLPEEPFPELFRSLYGESWEAFLRGWEKWLLGTSPPPGAELVYEERRLWLGGRASFLWPLLSEEEREEIWEIRQAIWRGEGSLSALQWADALLRGVWAEPAPALLSALYERLPSLKGWARAISGPEAAARITAISLLKYTDPEHPERFLREYIAAVNAYLVSPAPSPIGVAVP